MNKRRRISALDFYTLIHASMTAAQHPRIGWNHAETTYPKWLAELQDQKISISDDHLEDALYAANLLDEKKKFHHPFGLNFNTLLKRILTVGESFDKIGNIILRKKDL